MLQNSYATFGRREFDSAPDAKNAGKSGRAAFFAHIFLMLWERPISRHEA
jgi:hypothetical protein